MNSSLAPAMMHADQAQVVMLQGIASRIKAAIDDQGSDVFHGARCGAHCAHVAVVARASI